MLYQFNTHVTMKNYNAAKWWIDPDIIPMQQIEAGSLPEALRNFRDMVEDRYFITISNTALRRKAPMYIDTAAGTKQIGYVITGQTEFQREDYTWTSQYVELWIEISVISAVDFAA